MKAARFVSALFAPSHRVLSWWQGRQNRERDCEQGTSRSPTLYTISHPHSHCITLVNCIALSSSTAQVTTIVDFVKRLRSSNDAAPLLPSTQPGDRSSASSEYLHIWPQDKHPSVLSTATTTPPAYRITLCETLQRHSFHRRSHKDPPSAFHLQIHSLPSTLKQLLSHAVGPSN